MRLRRLTVTVAALAITATTAACGDTDEPAANATPGATSAPPPEPTETPTEPVNEPTETSDEIDESELVSEERVLTDYQRSIDAYLAAHDPADPDDPDLLATTGGDALERAQSSLQDLLDEGHSYEAEFIGDPSVKALATDAALVRDCYRSESQLIDTETGEPVGEPESSVHHVDVTLEPRDDRWVVVHLRPLEETCTPPE